MGRRSIIGITVALAVVLYVAFGAALNEYLDGARSGLWDAPSVETDLEQLDPPELRAELVRLGRLPVPAPGADPADRPTLARLAEAAAECTIRLSGPTPIEKAHQALMRYLLVFGAIGVDPATPLLEPRFRDLAPVFAQGPQAVLQMVANDALPAGALFGLADFHVTYSQPRHPLYLDLELYADTFPALNFDVLLARLVEAPDAIADCALSATLPAPPPPATPEPAPAPAEENGAVVWLCERRGEAFSLSAELLPTEPPTLRLERDGETREAEWAGSASGARYEGTDWAFWNRGGAAVLELPDGTAAGCVLADDAG